MNLRKVDWKLLRQCAVVSLLIAAGCTTPAVVATGRRFEIAPVAEGKARIAVYRVLDTYVGSAAHPEILIDGTSIGRLEPRGYVDAFVEPGRHKVTARVPDAESTGESQSAFVTAAAGEEVYVSFHWFQKDGWLKKVSPEVGRQEALNTRKSVE